MKWTRKVRDVFQWHDWFAWHPVQLTRTDVYGHIIFTYAWWEWVERRAQPHWDGCDWEYRGYK